MKSQELIKDQIYPNNNNTVSKTGKKPQKIAIAATFTAEPLEESLAFWMEKLKITANIEFAPYNQVFQELLAPNSLFSQNQQGINIILLRLEDWQQFEGDTTQKTEEHQQIERNVKELIDALKSAMAQSSIPCLMCLCPASPKITEDVSQKNFWQTMEDLIISELNELTNLYLVTPKDINTYPVTNFYDSQQELLGNIPFTPLFFTALGTILSRKIYRLKYPFHKVIVLDCDNTLWKGVVGEDGVIGIKISSPWKQFQEFLLKQQQAGMLICLCSKNNESDVLAVFQNRTEMPLTLSHIVAWRINWQPKSQNIKSLAQELNLGLDSFIFIDDNPVECAEVQANCPDVLTLTLPTQEENILPFIDHVWAFDRFKITQEDQQRTQLYKQNIERDRFQSETPTLDAFLAGLELKIEITEPLAFQHERVAQLTQRTNQFNLTTIRRTEADIKQLAKADRECRIVQVSDRFGDYGLVGVIIFVSLPETIQIDTFLLSCRVLGRGVEHRMLQYLAEIAQQRNLASIELPYIPSQKNLPALNFLESIGVPATPQNDQGQCFFVPVEVAQNLQYTPTDITSTSKGSSQVSQEQKVLEKFNQSVCFNHIATQMQTPEQILEHLKSQQQVIKRPLSTLPIPPRTEIEQSLVNLWMKLLTTEPVGIQDNYFELGGTSLLSVTLFAQIEQMFGKKLPLTTLLQAPTIEQLAALINSTQPQDNQQSLVVLQAGDTKTPLFLVHDGDGETLLYLNLAQCLQPQRQVYGIQPLSQEGYPMMHTRITEMAAHYITQILAIQPEGPYLLGGMCAGGVIAFEMAQQLQSQGQQVDLVALIDAADVEAPLYTGRISQKRLSRLNQALSQTQSKNFQQRLFYTLDTVTKKVLNVLTYEVKSKLQKSWDTFRMGLFRYYLDRGLLPPRLLQQISVRTVYLFAEKDYSPQGIYQGDVTLFRASCGEGTDEAYISVYSDPLLGWGKRITGNVKVYDIPGGHSSMLQSPNVQVMADRLQNYLDSLGSGKPTKPSTFSISSK